jgi:hypothetical protein
VGSPAVAGAVSGEPTLESGLTWTTPAKWIPPIVTYAHLRGASDRAIAHQTRHRSLATLGQYVRISEAWQDNAATQLGL